MIEWKVYDEDNPPKLNKDYLICIDGKYVKVAELWEADDVPYWVETQEFIRQLNVTHYAEINYPTL